MNQVMMYYMNDVMLMCSTQVKLTVQLYNFFSILPLNSKYVQISCPLSVKIAQIIFVTGALQPTLSPKN